MAGAPCQSPAAPIGSPVERKTELLQRALRLGHSVPIDRSQTAVITELKKAIASQALSKFAVGNLRCFEFERHLFRPLVSFVGKSATMTITPVPLNLGEAQFVDDIVAFHNSYRQTFFAGRELYLLRNFSRRGIGFFEDGGFYPDFILWVVEGKKQTVLFVDPKGLRNLEGFEDPKIRFHKTIKDIQAGLKDPNLVLESFVISQTPLADVSWWTDSRDEADFEAHHVLFQKPDGNPYVERMLTRAVGAPSGSSPAGSGQSQLKFG